MRDLAEYLAGLVDRLRHTSAEMGLLRVALLVASLLVVVMVRGWTGGDVGGLLLWLVGVLIVLVMMRPDSPAAGVFLAVVGLWWLVGAGAAEPWQHVTVVALLAAIHILAAQAGAVPSHASLSPSASYTLLVGTGAYVVVAGLGALGIASLARGGAALGSPAFAVAGALFLGVAVVTGVLLGSRQ